MDATASDTLDLRDYLHLLRRQWRLTASVVIVIVVVTMTMSLLQTPIYHGVAELAIEPVRSGSDATLEDLILGRDVLETERRVVTSKSVTDRVLSTLELSEETANSIARRVTVNTVENTRIVTITARDPDPVFAAQLANAYAAAYLDHRRDRAVDEVTAARANLDQRAQELQIEIGGIDRELRTSAASGDDDDQSTAITPSDAALQAQRDALTQQLALVGTQLATLNPGNSTIRGGGEILLPAEVPDRPVSPRPARRGALALILGLVLGGGLAFLRDHFDDAIRDEDDVKRVGGGVPVVGRITHWDDPLANQRLITLVDPHAHASEEFQALAANARFTLINRRAGSRTVGTDFKRQSLLVTSSTPGEGKSSASGNLAVAAAAAGLRVIIVDADLRQPTLASRFGIPDGFGLSDLLVNLRELSDADRMARHLIEVSPRLRVLPAGTIPPNPHELLASSQMTWLHTSLCAMADLVIYDTPPLLPVADTLEIASHVDLALVVVRTEKCHRRELQHAVERLVGVGADIGGFILNDLNLGKRSAYGYGYGYGAGEYRPRDGGSAPIAAPQDETQRPTRDGIRLPGVPAEPQGTPTRAPAPVASSKDVRASEPPSQVSAVDESDVAGARAESTGDAEAHATPAADDDTIDSELDAELFGRR